MRTDTEHFDLNDHLIEFFFFSGFILNSQIMGSILLVVYFIMYLMFICLRKTK